MINLPCRLCETSIVFFDHLLGAALTQKPVKTYKLTKNDQNQSKTDKTEKSQFWGTPLGSRSAFACRPALRSRQKHVFFGSFSDIFC